MSIVRKVLELARCGTLSEEDAAELLEALGADEPGRHTANQAEDPIAVVGMAGRFPDAPDLGVFWANLRSARDSVTTVPIDRWKPAAAGEDASPRRGAFLNQIWAFDPECFGMAPEEARPLDPQQRLMLEVAAEAIDDAGYGDAGRRRAIDVFIGGRMNMYGHAHHRYLRRHPELMAARSTQAKRATLLGRSQNFIAAWISDRLNLSGASLVVDTACSSSLTGLWLACLALRRGDSEMALVGGVDLLIDPLTFDLLADAKALSTTGRCLAFDRRADGYVPGEGAGAVVLKPLPAAQRDGDRVLGTLIAVAANNDGRTMGVTTPALEGQIELLSKIYGDRGPDPASIGYVEAHGTGTAIGDPIEVKALSEVFRRSTLRSGFCALGSVKTNIGHLHSAAGIAGLIKIVLALNHRQWPAMLNCEEPNPRLELESTPFYPNLSLRDVPPSGKAPCRAAISSFGFGGTNVHAVVEEAPKVTAGGEPAGEDLFVLSSHSELTLLRHAMALRSALEGCDEARLADVCATSRLRRAHETFRAAWVVRSLSELRERLRCFILEGREEEATQLRSTKPEEARTEPSARTRRLRRLAAAYVQGDDPDWKGFQQGRPYRCFPLPPRQYSRRWLELPGVDDDLGGSSPRAQVSADAAGGSDTLIDSCNRDARGRVVFRRRFFFDDAVVRQHAVLGRHMLPGVVWLEILRAAMRERETTGSLVVRDLMFVEPLVIGLGESTDVTGTIEPDGAFEIVAASGGVDARLFVTGRAEWSTEPEAENLGLRRRGQELNDFVSSSDLYHFLHRLGYVHGPFYQNVTWAGSIDRSTSLARLDIGRRGSEALTEGFDAGMLDSVTVAAIGGMQDLLASHKSAPFVPLFIEKVRLSGRCPRTAYVLTRVHSWNDETGRCSQVVTDSAGNVCLEFDNLTSKRVPAHGFIQDGTETRRALFPHPSTYRGQPSPGQPSSVDEEAVLHWLARQMGLEPNSDTITTPFLSLGLESLQLVESAQRIEEATSLRIHPTLFFEHPTLQRAAKYLLEEHADALQSAVATPNSPFGTEAHKVDGYRGDAVHACRDRSAQPAGMDAPEDAVAIIAMAGRYPQASDLSKFWDNLRQGRDAISEIPSGRWDWRKRFSPSEDREGHTYSRWGGFLEQIDAFDPEFFGVAPNQAAGLDPQARLFYEVAWETLEAAGYAASKTAGSQTGIWVGYSHDHDYEEKVRQGLSDDRGLALQSALPNRFSFFMDWRGPSIAVNTLCSSSLVALHMAVESLRSGECDMALVGGVHAALSPEYYVSMSRLRALSPTGRCRTFDASADGYVPGEGVGALLVKPLAQAVRDRDFIWAIIRGTAVNHGGRASRLSAPNPEAQAKLILKAWERAAIDPARISFVETHGTGTEIGDPIEIRALRNAFAEWTRHRSFCAIGSLKSQIGHLESAAGIAGIHKVVLCMQHRMLTPTLHVENVNPALELDDSPFYIVDRCRPWRSTAPRCAGVSAFGMLGVNAHVVLEEAPAPAPGEELAGPHVLRLSARRASALRELAGRFAAFLESQPQSRLADVCFTANTGRGEFRHRLALVGAERGELVAGLRQASRGHSSAEPVEGKTAFLFSGQGSQVAGMGRELYESESVFRRSLEASAEILSSELEWPLLSVLFDQPEASLLSRTLYAQPALVALEYALYELLRSWSVVPEAVLGHSVGEYTAACVAGVLSLEQGLRMVALRGRLMESLPADGAMASIGLSESQVREAIAAQGAGAVEVAAINSPLATVVSGPRSSVEALVGQLRRSGARTVDLGVSQAYHSAQVEPLRESLLSAWEAVPAAAPRLEWVSGASGALHAPHEAPDRSYWYRQLREPVRYASGLESLWRRGYRVFWELGPRPVLTGPGRQVLGEEALFLPTLEATQGPRRLLESLCRYYERTGASVDWEALCARPGVRRVPLPTYPFEHTPFRRRSQPTKVRSNPVRKSLEALTPSERTAKIHPLLDRRVTPAEGAVHE